MLNRLLGTKVGMTQIFDENRNAIPVTVVDIGEWFITQIKTEENDGYSALKLGFPCKKAKANNKVFLHLKEVLISKDDVDKYHVGQKISLKDFSVKEQDKVHVAGISRGLGFQGVVKRWGFSGGPGGHGSTFHRSPGSIGNMCSEGKVVKGKKLPGQCGCKRITVKNLKVVKVDTNMNCLFVKGAVPGKKNTLLFIEKQVQGL